MNDIWKKLADSSLDILIICDENGIICDMNRTTEESLGYSGEELRGESVDSLFLDKSFSLKEKMTKARKKYEEFETSIYRKNKTCYPVNLRIAYSAEDNKYFFIAENENELWKARKEVEYATERMSEASKVRNEFVANVTHELRTPVNGIKGHTQYLMMTEHTKDQDNELNIINECCLNMEKLINNILDFSKLEAGKFSLSNKDFVFADFMKYITETNGKLIEDKGLRFIVNVDPSIPEKLYGDDFRLTQVMNNLLSNALKFTQKGYIAVEVTKTMQMGRDVELYFMVMDSGIGIPQDKKDALFESFTQVDASISRTYGGTGLGLAITKQLVELMNGSIRLESEVGKGSSFSFTVRMELPGDVEVDLSKQMETKPIRLEHSDQARKLLEENELINSFGTDDNLEEIERIKDKLLLCLDLGNYAKAEQFADTLKALVLSGPPILKSLAFKMQMMIRKEDGEGAQKYFEELDKAIQDAVDTI